MYIDELPTLQSNWFCWARTEHIFLKIVQLLGDFGY